MGRHGSRRAGWRRRGEDGDGDGRDARVVAVGGGRAADPERGVGADGDEGVLRAAVDGGADQGRKLFPETGGHTCGQIDGCAGTVTSNTAAILWIWLGQEDRRKEGGTCVNDGVGWLSCYEG